MTPTTLTGRAYLALRMPLLFFVLIMLAGTTGYWIIGGGKASLVDAAYMTFITIATIGFGEVVDLSHSPGGRIFTMVIGSVGIANIFYTTSKLTAFIVESELSEVMRRRRMQDRIEALSGHYIICGIGRVGGNVAHELEATGRPYVALDLSPETVEEFHERYARAFVLHGDAHDDDWLRRAGIARAAGVFAVTGDDGGNLLITLTAKQLNPAVRVVARCHDVRNIEKLRRVGADAIVSPDFTGGMRIVSSMIRPTVVNFLDEMLRSDQGLRVEEVQVPEGRAPRALAELVPASSDYILLAVKSGGRWLFNPGNQQAVAGGDTLVVMTNPDGRHALHARVTA
jgi:voltage-gated potassium channel